MPKHRAVIVGAGRVGAGFNWHDDGYTHAGAYLALKDRVELVGFVEPNEERARAAWMKWGVMVGKSLGDFEDFDIVSVCTHPEQQAEILENISECDSVYGIWCEKPWVAPGMYLAMLDVERVPFIQVNYQRRADPKHQELRFALSALKGHKKLVVYGKDDETTRCHFRDLSRYWNVPLDYRPYQGPCAYVLETEIGPYWFDGGNGGVDSAKAFVGMLTNLLDCVEGKADLLSPPYVETP